MWLAAAAGEPPSANMALEHLAWCHALPCLAGRLTGSLWWELLDFLYQSATDPHAESDEADVLLGQLFGGELPLSLAYVLGELEPCRALVSAAREVLSEGLVELLDGEGMPHASELARLRPLLGCWTRAVAMGRRWKKGCLQPAARNQYEWLVRQAIRLTRRDARQVFSRNGESRWTTPLMKAALDAGGDGDDFEIAALALPKCGTKKKASRRGDDLPDPAEHSEWSELAILRAGWQKNTDLLAVSYAEESTRGELQSGGELLLSGAWETEVCVDGRVRRPTCAWEEVCWVSDEDGIYLELETELEGGLTLQRQMLLARKDRFLLLADAIIGSRDCDWQYRLTLPLAEGVRFVGADETREGWLTTKSRRVLAMPLALPEWRCDPRPGRLSGGSEAISLVQSARGRALYAPLMLDLDSRRQSQRYTWRGLTVAEQLEIVRPDVAVGFRVQIGKRQWLVYRALTSKGNRTRLGQNLVSEFLAARFHQDGQTEPLVEIQ